MQQYETKTFERLAKSVLGPGESTLYFNSHGETLGYVDFNADRTEAAVTVCDPYKGTSRNYDLRPVDKAQAILDRHVKKQGYEAPEPEDEAAQLAEQQINEQWHDFTEEAERGPLALEDARPVDFEGAGCIIGHPDDLAVGIDGDTIIVAQKHSDGSTRIVSELKGYAPISDAELEETGLKLLLEDIAQVVICPRCGINDLDVKRPALNARSQHAPVSICSPCGVHESLSSAGLDLWHDQQALRAALRARDEARARNTLCELTPSQSSAVRAAVVWP